MPRPFFDADDDGLAPEVPRPRVAWDRYPFESEEEHATFMAWLLSGLTVAGHATDQKLNRSKLERLSALHKWAGRRNAYQAHLHAIAMSAAEHEMRDRGADTGRMIDMGFDTVMRSLEHAQSTGEVLKLKDAMYIMRQLHDMQQIAAGRASVNVDLKGIPAHVLAALDEDILGDDEPEE